MTKVGAAEIVVEGELQALVVVVEEKAVGEKAAVVLQGRIPPEPVLCRALARVQPCQEEAEQENLTQT